MESTAVFDRVPPQDLEAERSVLGSILLDNGIMDDVAQTLEAKHFYRAAHQKIFEIVCKLHDESRACDLLILREELERAGLLDEIGGVPYLTELTEAVPTAANGPYYAEIVRDKSLLRSLITTCTEIVQETFESGERAPLQVDQAEKKFLEATQQRISHEAASIKEILMHTFTLLESNAKPFGVKTDFYKLDEMTTGLHGSELIILAARPSMGKTTFALNIARNAALKDNRSIAIFSLEMSKEQLGNNLLCGTAHVNGHKLRKNELTDGDWLKLTEAAGQLSEAKIYIDDTPAISVTELRAKARRQFVQHKIELILIDYLQLMTGSGKEDSRQQEISYISRSLKGLAKELEIPIIALAQLSRAVEQRESKRPRMSDLRESGAIEQDADLIWLLFREEYYRPDKEEVKGKAELIVAKHRNGATGTIPLTFIASEMRFENYYED